MNGIQIKSYLFPTTTKVTVGSISQVDEIRRFNLALNSGDGLYDCLIQKIQSSYGSLLPNKEEIKTYWIDDENEMVGFSSDNEFSYAIDVQTAIHISRTNTNAQPSLLFKVYVARKQVEQERPIFERPIFERSQNEPHNYLHFGVVCDGCDGNVVGTRFKCLTCFDYDLCQTCEKKGIHKEHSFKRIEKPSCTRKEWRHGHRGHGCHRQNQGPAHQNSFQQMFNNIMPQIATNIPAVSNPEQLKNFGEFMKGFLDPFGIDVSYYIDSLPKAEPKPESETKENLPTKEEVKVEEATETKVPIKRSESLMDESITLETPIITATTVMEKEKPSAPVEPLINYTDSPYEAATNALKEIIDGKEESVIVSNNQEKEINKVDDMFDDSGFNLVDIEKELKIIRAIEQLKSMGYRDDGGWLTRLASAKNGNINMVLDAIAPTGPRN